MTLHQILVHMCVETAQHLGHADILRELIDGSAGQRPGRPQPDHAHSEEWAAHRARIEAAARAQPDASERASGKSRRKVRERPGWELYSIVANSSLSSAVSCFRRAGVPISLPSMWFTGASSRMLEISQTASASNRSCGSSGP